MGRGRWKGLPGLWIAAVLAVFPGPVTVTAEDVPWETASPGSALKQENGTPGDETGPLTSDKETAGAGQAKDETGPLTSDEETAETGQPGDEAGPLTSDDETAGAALPEEGAGAATSEEETGSTESGEEPRPATSEEETGSTVPEEESSVAAYLYQGSREILAGGVIDAAEEGMSRITVEFDRAFGDQEPFQNIEIPLDQKLKGWRLWGYNSGSGFVGQDLYEIPGDGQISASQYQDFNTDPANDSLLVIPLWRNAREILDGDLLEMRAGDDCILSEGMWTVDGDSTVYSGGRTVYGARDGIFTFRKQE